MAHSSHAERERKGMEVPLKMVLWWTIGTAVFVAFLFGLGALVGF